MTGSGVVSLGNCTCRAILSAETASDTFFLVDVETEKALADACGALLINNVSDILVAEVTECGKNRVRSSLTKAAERSGLDVFAEFFETVDVFKFALAGDDLIEDLKKSSGTDTAGSAFTAGFVNGEVEEEAGDIYHTGVFIHYDETAGAHHGADGDKRIVIDGGVDE